MTDAAAISTPLEALFDRTACLVPNVQSYTTEGPDQVWVKPSHAVEVEFVVVGGGGGGADGGTAAGGGSGASGHIRTIRLPAALVPDTLTLTVGTGGYGNMTSGDGSDGYQTTVYGDIAGREFYIVAPGGNGGKYSVDSGIGGIGGAGVVPWSVAGSAGATSPATSGGSGLSGYGGGRGGAAPSAEDGLSGVGYGAGGGGGEGSLSAGGAGGAGGYGSSIQTSSTPGGAGNGKNGAVGCVIITTWRGVAL